MKTPIRVLAWILAAALCLPLSVSAFAVGDDSLTRHADTVSVSYYNSVKIISGFTAGETFGGAAHMFADNGNIQFVDLSEKRLINDLTADVFTGALICATENAVVKDMGLMAVFGDLNGDGKVTSVDARLALRHAAALERLGAVAETAGDVDCSGRLNSADARRILRHAARLETIENPIGNVSDDSVPIAIHAYYTGGTAEAGTKLDLNAVKVIAVYSDARQAVVESGFEVSPDDLTSRVIGKKTFTVSWQGLSAEFTVDFTRRTAASFYPDSKVPDYTGYTGVSALEALYNPEYITYVYPAADETSDFVRFSMYMNYLGQCGFTASASTTESSRIIAAFTKADNDARVALIYVYAGNRIYVAVYN